METIYRLVGLLLFTMHIVRFAQGKPYEKPICDVTDETSPSRFNFTGLSEAPDDIVVPVEHWQGDSIPPSKGKIRLRLCGPLRKPCNNLNDYSFCLTKGKEEIGIGRAPPDVTATYGRVQFKFTGEQCTDDKMYTVHVTMECDNNEDRNNSRPFVDNYTNDNCSFFMKWRTKAACNKEFTTDCKAKDKNGLIYDLSSLTRRSDNYYISLDSSDSRIILNVCHSVVNQFLVACQGKSGACLRKSIGDEKYEFNDWGEVHEAPYFENDELTLKYDSGEICRFQDTPHVETVITFKCDYNELIGFPKYVGGAEECRHRFIWTTAAACSVDSLKNHSLATAGDCKITDPLTNFEYNLKELMNKDYHIKTLKGEEYSIRVCGSVRNSSCPSGTGGCLMKNGTSTGSAKTNLMWSQGGPYLNYTDGAVCDAGRRRYTLIAFFCGAEDSAVGPTIIKDESCALIIHWNTPLICDKRIKCETEDHSISLASLIRSSDNYIVKAKDTEFHINVCRSLVPKPYLSCLHGSAACQVIPDSNGKFSNETSIGYPRDNPLFDKDKRVILRYVGGSSCPEDSNNTISSEFTFLCDYTSGIGEPRYKYYKNCTHAFDWTTSVVCGEIEGRWSTGCMIENPRLSHKFNLASLRDKPVYSVKSRFGDQYNISICGGEDFCKGSAVCKADEGYGLPSVVRFDYNRNIIILRYVNGTKCGNDFHSSELRFVCDESAGNGEPKLIWESPCTVNFEWKTKVFCVDRSSDNVPDSVPEPKAEETMENIINKPNATGHVAAHVGIAALVAGCVVLTICLWSAERRARMRACFRSLTSRREHCRAHYTKVNATEEARLLLDIADAPQSHADSDSDDELLDA